VRMSATLASSMLANWRAIAWKEHRRATWPATCAPPCGKSIAERKGLRPRVSDIGEPNDGSGKSIAGRECLRQGGRSHAGRAAGPWKEYRRVTRPATGDLIAPGKEDLNVERTSQGDGACDFSWPGSFKSEGWSGKSIAELWSATARR